MHLYTIATKCNGPLEAARVYIDDDRYDMVDCRAVGQLHLDVSDQVHDHSIASTNAISLSSVNVLAYYCHQVY